MRGPIPACSALRCLSGLSEFPCPSRRVKLEHIHGVARPRSATNTVDAGSADRGFATLISRNELANRIRVSWVDCRAALMSSATRLGTQRDAMMMISGLRIFTASNASGAR
jgi:hypothetical protein